MITIVSSDHPDYPRWAAAIAAGEAQFLGERYELGRRLIAVETEAHRRNQRDVTFRIGAEYYTKVLNEYADWREKWWREALQNAVDAGATRIACDVVEGKVDGVSVWQVSCDDNGAGMDEDTLINKFLVLGGTTKTGETTTGGFGVAKSLLILPWVRWRIETRDLAIEGAQDKGQFTNVPLRKGTRLTVWMPESNTTTVAAAIAVIEKSYLPTISFTANGKKMKADLGPGEIVRSLSGKADLVHIDNKERRSSLLVRSNGLYMFSEWAGEDIIGQMLLELRASSTKLLSANRDSFRDYSLGVEVRKLMKELSIEWKTVLRGKLGMIAKKYKGEGSFSASLKDQATAALIEVIGRSKKDKRGHVESVVDIEHVLESAAGERHAASWFVDETRVLLEILKTAPTDDSSRLERVSKALLWQPDYYVLNEREGFKVGTKFFPETMSSGVRRLVRTWAEFCRWVFVQLGSDAEYGVGVVFSEGAGAMYKREGDEHWLLFNPLRQGALLDPTVDADLAWLYAAAIHECTHMADGVDYHDESFATALTRNIAKTVSSMAEIKRIGRLAARVVK